LPQHKLHQLDGANMRIIEPDEEKGPFEIPELDPEVKEAMTSKVTEDLEKSGVKKSDSKYGDLLKVELALRLAKAESDAPGFNKFVTGMRIRDVQRRYGKDAPQMLQALGLRHRQPAAQKSNEALILDFLQKKQKSEEKAEDRALKKKLYDVQFASIEGKATEKAEKKAHSPLNKRIESGIKLIESELKEIKKSTAIDERTAVKLAPRVQALEEVRSYLQDAKLIKDAESKKAEMLTAEELRRNIGSK